MLPNAKVLIGKIQSLPPERVAEVDDFVEFLRTREQDRQYTHAAAQASVPAFAAAWDNPEDEAYDAL